MARTVRGLFDRIIEGACSLVNVSDGRVRKAYIWTLVTNLVRQALTFGLSILLARLLGPNDYGLVGIATVYIVFLSALQDLGIGQSVVYFANAEDALATYCTLSTAAGFALSLIVFLSAPLLGRVYNLPELVPVMRWLSITLFLSGARSVPQAIITKRLLFRKIAIIETAGGLCSAVTAVWLAWHGFGVWSLVTNLVLSSSLNTALVFAAQPPKFTVKPDLKLCKAMIRWGSPLTGSTLLCNFYENADDMVVGKLMNAEQLGCYSLAFRLATLVNERIGAIISRVSFPALSGMRDNPEGRIRHWLSVTQKSALISFPFLAVLAVTAHDLIAVMLGVKWLPAVVPLRLLCVVGMLRVLTPIAVNMIAALGRPKIAFCYTLGNAIVMPVSFFAGCRIGGVAGVAWAWALVFPFIAGGLILRVLTLTDVSWRTYAANLRSPLMTAGAVLLATSVVLSNLGPGLLRLVACCGTAALVFTMSVLLTAEGRDILPVRVAEFGKRRFSRMAFGR